jgi:hypothetical protein
MSDHMEALSKKPTQSRRPIWAIASIALAGLGYAQAFVSRTCIESALACSIKEFLAFRSLVICAMLAFVTACVAARRRERHGVVWLSFLVSGPFLLYIVYVVIRPA